MGKDNIRLRSFSGSNASEKENKEILEALFLEYYPWLVNYASRIIHDAEASRDLVQETFYKLWDNQQILSKQPSLQAYLFKAVYSSCIDLLRHRKVESRFLNEVLKDFYFKEIIQTPEAELKLIDSNIRDMVLDACEKLPERCRKIFILSKLEGKSNKEVAEELNISVKTVENQMTIALVRLRKELDWLLSFILIFL